MAKITNNIAFKDYIFRTMTEKFGTYAPTKIADNKYKFTQKISGAKFVIESFTTNVCAVKIKLAEECKGIAIYVRKGLKSSTQEFFFSTDKLSSLKTYTFLFNFDKRKGVVLANGRYVVDINTGFQATTVDDFNGKLSITLYANSLFAEKESILHIENFGYSVNAPNDTTALYKQYLYQKDDAVYGMDSGILSELSPLWTMLTDVDKENLFAMTDYAIPTLQELSQLEKFKQLVYSDLNNQESCTVVAVPKDQLILPKELIAIESFEGIDKAIITSNVSANAKCKLLITTDLTTYQTYDFSAQQWKSIDHTNVTDVKNDGIDAVQIQNIPRADWDILTAGKSGIGFAYLLSIEAVTDTCDIDKLELQVDMKGSWDKAVHGTDYKYGYPKNNVLTVSLLSDGDYKINYSKG